MDGDRGAARGLDPGAIWIQMGSVGIDPTERLARIAKAHELTFVDAPVGRLASHAERGESLFMVGATGEAFARASGLARSRAMPRLLRFKLIKAALSPARSACS